MTSQSFCMFRVRVRVRGKIRVRFRFRVKIRVRVRHHKMFCMVRVRVKIRVRFRIRVRISIILKRCSSPVLVLAHPPLPGNRQLLASAECLDGIVPLASAHGVFRS